MKKELTSKTSARELRAQALDKMHELRDTMKSEKRDLMTVEERKAWDESNADFDRAQEFIERDERQATLRDVRPDGMSIGGEFHPTGGGGGLPDLEGARALAGWAKQAGGGIPTAEEREALGASGMQVLGDGSLRMNLPARRSPLTGIEERALGTALDASGGVTVPVSVMQTLVKAKLSVGPMLDYVRVLRTGSGETMSVPTWSGTSERGELTGEASGVSDDNSTPFGEATLSALKWDSRLIKISMELLQDSALDMAAELGKEIGERLGRAQCYYLTAGNGTSEPEGILEAVSTTSVDALDVDALIDLTALIDEGHQASPSCAFLLNRQTRAKVRKLKDDQGQYLWQPSVRAGEPDSLLGFPCLGNPYLSSTATAGTKPVVFGDLSRCFLREVRSLDIRRLNERFIDSGQIGFLAFMRFDSAVVDPGSNALAVMEIASGS